MTEEPEICDVCKKPVLPGQLMDVAAVFHGEAWHWECSPHYGQTSALDDLKRTAEGFGTALARAREILEGNELPHSEKQAAIARLKGLANRK